jgi:hypothetical protein
MIISQTVFRTLVWLVIPIAVASCTPKTAAEYRSEYIKASSMTLCFRQLSGPNRVSQGPLNSELASRGEDCTKYVSAWKAKEEAISRRKAATQRWLRDQEALRLQQELIRVQQLNPTRECTVTGPYEMRSISCR